MDTKFRATLKLAHINSWDWDLETKELHLINVADLEEMRKISPRMAMESVVISNYPEVLFEKNLVKLENEHLVRKYEKLILDANVGDEVSFRLPFNTRDNDTVWLQFFCVITDNKAKRAMGYYTAVDKQIEIARVAYDFDAIHEAYDNVYSEVLLGLCADYSNVFWVDLATEGFRAIRLDSTSQALVGSLLDKTESYRDIVYYYIKHFVYEEDQEKLMFLLDPVQIQEVLKNRKIFTCDYRSARMNELVYCQVKVAKGNNRHSNTITIGFKNVDTQYRSRMELDYDALTGLYNRNAFFRYMQEKMKEYPDCSFNLIISDIENFKRINDLYGEKMGDTVLRYVGGFLGSLTKMIPDCMFGRYSGDQFVGLFMSQQSSEEQNAAILSEGMEEMYVNSPIGRFDVKFGMYMNIDRSLSPAAVCDRALMAVRAIKHQYNLNFSAYDSQMEMAYQKELRILENMEEALDKNQFKVYYQPKHDCQTGALIGAEALSRWEHPEFGFMSPGDFIPLFEKNGFITNLDLYVLKQVCEDQKRLFDAGLPIVPVSINASRLDLLRPDFGESFIRYLKKEQADPSWFHLEITESIFMENEEILCPILNEMKEFGVQIELDDFGSGYSSLNMLNSLPLDIIKLDKGLIKNLDEHIHVVDASIRLAHVLGYKTIAEGVETLQQMNSLRNMNCDMIQGYYYSKPLPINGYTNYLKYHLNNHKK